MPKVSIIIPAYNAMKYLPETLNSVWQQTFCDYEILIVNDGSSDNIEDWVAQVSQIQNLQIQNSRSLKLISQPNQGQSSARNRGIESAQGEYIVFLDADDLWEPSKLEKEVYYLDNNPNIGLVYSWTAIIDINGKLTGRVMKPSWDGNIFSQLLLRNIIDNSSVMVRRNCFDEVGLFDNSLRFNEDWEMWIRIASRYEFASTKEILVYYRHHPGNSSNNWYMMQEGYQTVIDKAYNLASSKLAPIKLQSLKKHSYSNANLVVAWKALQSQDKDWKIAADFRDRAFSLYPQVLLQQEFWRLSIAIALMQYLGKEGYSYFLDFAHKLRTNLTSHFRSKSNISTKLSQPTTNTN
jgi:glycosyltransferase involved in cell wall biosynthesis